jgi:cobalt-zinc-cadmium efflux system protein
MKDAPAPRFAAADRVRLALALTAAILVVEVVGGIWAHSLALLSDAGHVVTDLLVLGFSAFALMQGRRPANPRKTFGYHRVGILVALGNAVILGAVVVGIVVEAVHRLQHPGPVGSAVMLGAAAVALTVSIINSRNLQEVSGDLSIRSALVHIRGDALASAAVMVGAVVIALTGQTIADPILSLGIAALIAWSAWQVLAAAVEILLESTPSDLRPAEVIDAVKTIPGVRDLHDLHLWSLGAEIRAMSAHLLVDDQRVIQAQEILAEVRELLAHRFHIEHTTIQFEGVICQPGDVFCVQPDGHPHLDDVHDRMLKRSSG